MGIVYDGRAVANFVLDQCDEYGRDVTNLALQKIVYFCHVWSLIELHRPLVRHSFEAWEFGPVLPYLYREFRSFDRARITSRATKINPSTGEIQIVDYDFDESAERLLTEIVNFYSRLSAGDLVALSHARNGPWHKVWNHKGAVNPGMKISDADIAEFYSRSMRPFSLQ